MNVSIQRNKYHQEVVWESQLRRRILAEGNRGTNTEFRKKRIRRSSRIVVLDGKTTLQKLMDPYQIRLIPN
jgi:hypothetical protein